MPKKKYLQIMIASICLPGALLTGCGNGQTGNSQGNQTTQKPHMGGSILLDTTSTFQHLDPAKAYFQTDYEAVEEMYDQLVTYKGSDGKIVPDLAKTWDVSPDGKTYTFHLRTGVKFWNGDSVNAQSFIDEFERVLGKGGITTLGEGFIDPAIEGASAYHAGKAKSVSGLSAPDPQTLVIRLTNPESFFLQILAMPFFSAVDEHYIEQVGNDAMDVNHAMGTGPFKLNSVDTNGMVLIKNPNYWMTDGWGNHYPYLDKVTIRINKNGNIDALNFEHGETALLGNLMQGIPSSNYPEFKSNPALVKTLLSLPQNEFWYVAMNNHVTPFSNPKVRVALQYAIDKDKLIKLMNGRAMVANQPLPPGITGYMKNLPDDINYKYNPAKAKELLAKAGYPNGFTQTLFTPIDPDFVKVAQSIAYDFGQVGVHVDVRELNDGTFWSKADKGDFPMFLGYWQQDYPDSGDFMYSLFDSVNAPQLDKSLYKNDAVNTLLDKAQTDPNQSERIQLYDDAMKQILREPPLIFLFYPVSYYSAQPWIHGFYISPTMADPLQYIWMDGSH